MVRPRAILIVVCGLMPSLCQCGRQNDPASDLTTNADVQDSPADSTDGGPNDGMIDSDAGDPGPFLVREENGVLRIDDGALLLEIDQKRGEFALSDKVNDTHLRGLHPAMELATTGDTVVESTQDREMPCAFEYGEGTTLTVRCEGSTPSQMAVEMRFTLRSNTPGLLGYETTFRNASKITVKISRIFPFIATSDSNGLILIGSEPGSLRMLQNGSDEVVDFYVNILPGDTALSNPNMNALTGSYSSYSNGDLLVHDLKSGASFLVGFTQFPWATPLVSTGRDEDSVPLADGRVPLGHLASEARFAVPVKLGSDDSVAGGKAVFVLAAASPFAALETYADEVARDQNIVLPSAPLSGWDSWYTGVGSSISEEFIRENADGLSAQFQAFGLSSMQTDSGWQDTWGDWNGGATFPSGLADLAFYVAARNLSPELWIAPLSAEESSDVYKQHKDEWFLTKDFWGSLVVPGNMHAFDLSRSDVIAYIRGLGERVRAWGFKSVKMDFAYYNLLGEVPPSPTETAFALYRRGVAEFRSALGPDVYFTNISMCFANYGLVDGFRIGLDDWPCWDGGGCGKYVEAKGISAQGVKPAVRMASRRYWMNGRIWWNHQDQVFFRDLTPEEARALLTYAALSGGMVSLGETASSLSQEQVETFRRILPLLGLTARPLDLFRREFPEVWHLPIRSDGIQADVVALFHWGQNRDLSTNPYQERADGADVTQEVALASLGLDPVAEYIAYEFWSDTVLESVTGSLEVTISPHSVRLYNIIQKPSSPVFLATNRHVLMGPGIVTGLAFDPVEQTLTGYVRSGPEFQQTLLFWLPDNYTLVAADVDGAEVVTSELPGGHVIKLSFTGTDAEAHAFEVTFQAGRP